MRFKLLNFPKVGGLSGFVWVEVCVGASVLTGLGITVIPF